MKESVKVVGDIRRDLCEHPNVTVSMWVQRAIRELNDTGELRVDEPVTADVAQKIRLCVEKNCRPHGGQDFDVFQTGDTPNSRHTAVRRDMGLEVLMGVASSFARGEIPSDPLKDIYHYLALVVR
ncbi:MAG: hypothetical protein WC604_00745 [Candidatus Gracilibacteria bacterium]